MEFNPTNSDKLSTFELLWMNVRIFEDLFPDEIGRANPTSVVYFIANRDYIKIGFSAGIERRTSTLQSASPVKLEPLGIVLGNTTDENALQLRFSHLRAHGEWFRKTPELLRYIEVNAIHIPETFALAIKNLEAYGGQSRLPYHLSKYVEFLSKIELTQYQISMLHYECGLRYPHWSQIIESLIKIPAQKWIDSIPDAARDLFLKLPTIVQSLYMEQMCVEFLSRQDGDNGGLKPVQLPLF